MEGQPIPPRHPRNPRPAQVGRSSAAKSARQALEEQAAGKQEQEAGCGEEARVTVDRRPRGLRKATSGQDRKGDEQDSAAGRERQTPAPPANEARRHRQGTDRERRRPRARLPSPARCSFGPRDLPASAGACERWSCADSTLPARASRPCQRRGGQRGAIGSSQNADRLTNVEGNPRGDGSLTRPPGRRAHPMGNADLHPDPQQEVVAPARKSWATVLPTCWVEGGHFAGHDGWGPRKASPRDLLNATTPAYHSAVRNSAN